MRDLAWRNDGHVRSHIPRITVTLSAADVLREVERRVPGISAEQTERISRLLVSLVMSRTVDRFDPDIVDCLVADLRSV